MTELLSVMILFSQNSQIAFCFKEEAADSLQTAASFFCRVPSNSSSKIHKLHSVSEAMTKLQILCRLLRPPSHSPFSSQQHRWMSSALSSHSQSLNNHAVIPSPSRIKTSTPVCSASLPLLPRPAVRCFGQPAAQTHPHLLNSGEVTPNITKEEYRRRRTMLVTMARNMFKGSNSVDDHLFVFPSACKVYMTNDIPYPFRQNSDFLYLSGFQEPNSVLVIHSSNSDSTASAGDNHQSILFVPKKDPCQELWEGPRSGKKGAVELTGVDSAYNYCELEQFLSCFCKDHHKFLLWYDFTNPVQSNFHSNIMLAMIGQERHKAMENTTRLMHNLRVKKSPAEVELMQQTVQIASEAFIDVMRFSHPQASLMVQGSH